MFSKLKKGILIFGDLFVLYLSLFLTLILRYQNEFSYSVWQLHILPFSIIYIIWILFFYIAGLYDFQLAKNNVQFYSTLIKTIIFSFLIAVLIFYLVPFFEITPKTNLFLNASIFLVLFIIWRRTFNKIAKSTLIKKLVVIGEGKEVNELIEIIRQNPQLGYLFLKQINQAEKLKKEIIKLKPDVVIVAQNEKNNENITDTLYQLLPLGISVFNFPNFYSQITKKIPISIIGKAWFLENLIESEKGIYEKIKRFYDIVLALIIGITTLPFYPLIILLILLTSKGNPFYIQTRVGKQEKIFKLFKFRTMVQDAEKGGAQWTKENDPRITKVGSFLRKTRIDELPQIFNVLKGDLSFIGPRPERPEFIEKLKQEIPHYQLRHLVKPGLTGLAQIKQPFGTASIKDSTEKLQYDLYYIKNRSFALDFDILAKTIMIILKRKGR